MAAFEREPGPRMIKGDRCPGRGGMTEVAAGVHRRVGGGPSGGRRLRRCGCRQEDGDHGTNSRKAPRWTSTWQPAQVVGTPRYWLTFTLPARITSRWQSAHAVVACLPCSSNAVQGGRSTNARCFQSPGACPCPPPPLASPPPPNCPPPGTACPP